MRILILGGDGYLGWPTAMYLANRNHEVAVVDSFHRRLWDHELGADSLIPIGVGFDSSRYGHYAAFLRAINVGGHTVKMDDLRRQ